MNKFVSRAALVQRVNRRLRAEGKVLRASRSRREFGDLGSYYILDVTRNVLVASHIADLALDVWVRREMPGVLRDDEEVAS